MYYFFYYKKRVDFSSAHFLVIIMLKIDKTGYLLFSIDYQYGFIIQ